MTANYYAWQGSEVRCPACAWRGTGASARTGELFDEGVEFRCPGCGGYLAFGLFPTEKQVLTDPRASQEDREAVTRRRKRLAAFDAAKLRRPEQLPDLPGAPLELTWHHEGDEVLIRHGHRVIWREAAWWECYERFGEVARILRQGHGEALRDLVPTSASELYLYGDKLSAPDFVEGVREALREGRVPPGG